MQTQTLIYIILAILVALALALFQYIYKSKKQGKIYWFLAALRFMTVLSILLLLINPKFDSVTYYNEKPNLLIAVDNSESVAYLKQDTKAKALLETLRQDEALNERFDLEFYSFGKELIPLDTLAFNEKQSNLAKVFERFSEVFNNAVSPTVLISDGNQTYGSDYVYLAKKYKHPIFPVILGDTTRFADLKIEQLNVNRYAFLKNKFPVEIIANYSGTSAINTQLKVSSGTATVFSKPLSFSKDNTSQIVNFNLPANRVGIGTYKAELLPMDNEQNTINNVKNFAVEVIDQKTNVAIVSEIIHPDLGTFKKAIERNEQRQASILNVQEFLKQSNDFQLVIAYQPTNDFKLLFEEVDRLKLNKIVVAGTNTNWSQLNKIQTNYKQQITNQTEEFQPTLNQNYGAFIVDDLNFEDFPPLKSEFGETNFLVPTETILYKTINGIQIDEPMIATFEVNERREALILGEGIWRWRAQTYFDEGSFNNFDDFVGKLVQYLSSNKRRSRLNVNYESFYNGNENVILSAQFFNKNYEFDANANLEILLDNKDTDKTTRIPFVLNTTNYQVDLSGLEAGDYSFKVNVASENISKAGDLKILDYNVEQQFLNANVSKMETIAMDTDGRSYFIDQTNAFTSDLLNDSRFAIVQKSSKNVVPLIDIKYLLALMMFCLFAEWFIRKYNGLI
ncbi:VWA domain-containing protein [Subsaximicrobium wynnwilliamsii]|uniref:VWA domain-containing protein n=1 Tax=Subsaximicrobium wynnwilliamsii TaxID=291179 RepID=A0A5C6ZHW0_9FLAO|nr:VWA domain-containing protein [Subsaximicrobium wynnwilliamsii]TXD84136.1 VWA domain-containing protein [Subsaximicrobium wynnwilliamsii]TXD88906.1 VWA domain-containing protein [Subsaximicrobium wynnwilliamsii]TXE03848.1 VWA domain-containing protein [Subsaximicrobium wynnwilliamsii]